MPDTNQAHQDEEPQADLHFSSAVRLGFRVQGFRVWGLGFRVQGFGEFGGLRGLGV